MYKRQPLKLQKGLRLKSRNWELAVMNEDLKRQLQDLNEAERKVFLDELASAMEDEANRIRVPRKKLEQKTGLRKFFRIKKYFNG